LTRPISGIVDVLALQDPPIHSRQRRIAMKSLSPKFFRSLEDEVRVLTRGFFKNIFTSDRRHGLCRFFSLFLSLPCNSFTHKYSHTGWMKNFANVLPMRVTLRLLGLPEEEHEMVKKWADCGVALLAGVNTSEEFVRLTLLTIFVLF
jgi:cytochrome P450 family 144